MINGTPAMVLRATDGTAIQGTDYNLGTNIASFAQFIQRDLNFHSPSASGVWTYPNSSDEPDKTFTWAMVKVSSNDPRFNLGSRTTTTVVIRDNDPTIVSLARIGTGVVTEGGTVEFTVTLGRALVAGEVIDVPLRISGTGVVANDWSLGRKSGVGNTGVSLRDTGTSTPKVRFSGTGAQTATLELTLTTVGLGNFIVALGSNGEFDAAGLGTNVGGGADPHGTSNVFAVAVGGSAPCSNCAWITGGDAVTEGGDAVFTVHVNPPPTADVTVPLWVYDSPGNSVADYVLYRHENHEEVTIPSGASGAVHTVPTKDDDRDEPHGSVRVEISGTPTGPGGDYYEIPNIGFFPYYLARGPQSASVSVWDNDAGLPRHVPPAVSVSALWGEAQPSRTVNEGELAYFCFGIDGGAYPADHPRRFWVDYEITASPSGRDVQRGALQLSSATTKLCLDFDTDGAGAETWTARVLPSSLDPVWHLNRKTRLYTVGSASTASIEVLPKAANQVVATPPTLTIAADAAEIAEGGAVTFTVTADQAPGIDIPVNLGTSEEMGEGLNYVGFGQTGTVTIAADETSAAWTVTTYSDEVERADGTVTGRIKPSADYVLGEPSSVTLALLDDDGTDGGTADGGTTDGAKDGGAADGGTTDGAPEPPPVAQRSEPPGVDPTLIAEVKAHVADFAARNHAAGIRDWTAILNRLEGRDGGMGDGDIAAWLARSQQHGWEDGAQTLPKVQTALAALAAQADPPLVADVRAMAAQTHHGAAHVNRWRRVLMAFGEGSWPGLTPMTAAEAEENARRHSSPLWPRIAEILTARESTSAVESAPPGGVSAQLLADVADRAGETHLGAEHVERWLRALHTLEGVANDATIMLPAEARALVPLDPGRWGPVAEAIERLEARAFADALGN